MDLVDARVDVVDISRLATCRAVGLAKAEARRRSTTTESAKAHIGQQLKHGD